MNYSEEFKQAIRSFGSIPPDMFVPGKIHRIPGIGKHKGNRDAWCMFFEDGLGGVCGDWSSGSSETWQAERPEPLSPEEKQEFMRRAEESKRQAESERKEKANKAAKQSLIIWRNAKPCVTHAYCEKKHIKPDPARELSSLSDECKGWFWTTNDNGDYEELKGNLLLLPLYNIGGELRGLQGIDAEGRKSLIKGLSKQGLFIPITGEKLPADYAGKIYVGEGFSTTKTVGEATNNPAIAAIDANNLLHVAKVWRDKCPLAEIILCGDLDESGTGQKSSLAAALAVDGFLAIPPFTGEELAVDHPPSDWNDYATLYGLEAIESAILNVKTKGKAQHQPNQNNAAEGEYKRPIRAVDLHELAKMQFKPRDPLLEPWLHSQDLCMVFAKRGIGKTHFSLALAYAVATGSEFLDWQASQPRKVLYLDGELPGNVMQTRLLMHLPEQEPQPEYLRIFTPDLLSMDELMPDLATPQGQAIINTMIEPDTALVVVDNLSAWARGTRAENDAESWLPIASWVLALRRRGIAVMLVHHAGKTGDQRGTSKREDLLDVVIRLSRPTDYDPKQGARFEMTFTKARNLHGADAEGLEVTLLEDSNGSASWSWNTLEGSTYLRVIDLANEGLSQADIARELEVNRSTVSRHYRRAHEEGKITKPKIGASL